MTVSLLSFPIWIPFICLSCLLALTKTSNTMLDKSGNYRYPSLVPGLIGKVSNFTLLSVMLIMAFIMFWHILSIFTLVSFYPESRLKFIKCFFLHLLRWSYDLFLFFILLMGCITLIDSERLNHSCIPGVNLAGSWCMILSVGCWIHVANILLMIFPPIFIRNLAYNFLLFMVFLSGFNIRIMLAS